MDTSNHTLSLSRRSFFTASALGAAGLILSTSCSACAPNTPGEKVETPATGADAPVSKIDTSNIAETLEYDVAVVGAGSGLFAAYVAAKEGLNVIVIEKGSSSTASNTNVVFGTTAGDTKIQSSLGDDTTTDEIYERMMTYAQGTVDQVLVRKSLLASKKCLETWADLGCDMILAPDRYGVGFNSVHLFAAENKTLLLEKAIEELGGTCMFSAEALELIVDDDAVCGLYVQAPQGLVEIKAKRTVLSTGGFMANEEMLDQFFGAAQTIANASISQCDGAGIRMAQQAGAIVDTSFSMSSYADVAGYNAKSSGIIGNYMTDRNQALIFGNIGCILVDGRGDRFINEYFIASNPLAFGGAIQTRVGYYYAIVDQTFVDALKEQSPFSYVGRPQDWLVGPILFDAPQPRLAEDMEKAIEEGWAWKADSIDALAEQTGLGNLPQQIDAFNNYCSSGKDELLGLRKEFLIPVENPPFYAIQYQAAGLSTMGGIKTDSRCRALNENNDPISGLYITGSDNGSAFSEPYYDVGGTDSAMCFGTNWVAGESIVSELV